MKLSQLEDFLKILMNKLDTLDERLSHIEEVLDILTPNTNSNEE